MVSLQERWWGFPQLPSQQGMQAAAKPPWGSRQLLPGPVGVAHKIMEAEGNPEATQPTPCSGQEGAAPFSAL